MCALKNNCVNHSPVNNFFKHTNILEELCVSQNIYPKTTLSEHTLLGKLRHTLLSEAVNIEEWVALYEKRTHAQFGFLSSTQTGSGLAGHLEQEPLRWKTWFCL